MECSTCPSCGETSVSYDEEAGVTVCYSCGRVSEEVVFRHVDFDQDGVKSGTFIGGRGTAVSVGGLHRANWSTSNSLGIDYKSLARKTQNHERIDELSSLLSFPKEKANEVKHMIGVITEDKYGSGHWIDVLIGTCIYVVARQAQLPLPVREVASYLDCGIDEIMRTYRQVCHLLDLESCPAINQCAQFDRVTCRLPGFSSLGRDAYRRVCKQGHCLLECASDWFLSTGRHPSAIVAAAILAVGKANKIEVDLDYVSRELHVFPKTSRLRYREIMNALIGMAEKLPWGKDIKKSTVEKHLPFLLQFLQTRKKLNPEKDMKSGMEKQTTSKECIAAKQLVKAIKLKYGDKVKQLLEKQPFVLDDGNALIETSVFPASKFQETTNEDVFDESSAIVPYAQIVDVDSEDKAVSTGPPSRSSKKRKVLSVDEKIREFELLQMQIQKKETVWKPLPPAYLANESAKLKRMLKIEAAKKRIHKVKQEIEAALWKANGQSVAPENEPQDLGQLDKENPHSDIGNAESVEVLDAEDFLIQYCLICGGDENLIKAGYFHIVLSTPPVQNHQDLSDEDLHQYFRSSEEIRFLESMEKGEELLPFLGFDEL